VLVAHCHYGTARVGHCHYGMARVGHCHYGMARVGHCHYSMARSQVADGGTASNMEGSCEYVEYAIAETRQVVVLRIWCWTSC